MTDIISLLKRCDEAYFNNTEDLVMSDSDYDKLKRVAQEAHPDDDYFAQVGSEVRTGKIKLPYPMGSLDQIYDGDIVKWVTKHSLDNKEVLITEKLDGASCLLLYRKGKFVQAFSRGNGTEGADITRHLKVCLGNLVDISTKCKHDLVIRAETIIKKDIFEDAYANTYVNARNMVSGCMNRKVTENSILKNISIVCYEIVDGIEKNKTKKETLDLLESIGFTIPEYIIVKAEDLNDSLLSSTVTDMKTNSEFMLDGIVITINDYNNVSSFRKSESLNPEHSLKYKFINEDSIVTATVTEVNWEISKSGYLKPVVKIVPVKLFETTVTYATGFNGKFIRDGGIGPGAKIKITKAGEVIPYIVSVEEAVMPSLPDSSYDWEWNDNDVEIVVSQNNETVIFKQVLDFFNYMEVELLKEASLEKLYNKLNLYGVEYDSAISKIFDLVEYEWTSILGVNGGKIYQSLHRRLQNMTPAQLLGSSKHMGIGFGVRKAKQLLNGVATLDDIWNITESDIIAKEGFDIKTARNVLKGLPKVKTFFENNSDYITVVYEERTAELNNLNIVMTGFRDKELQEKIEKMGGKVSSTVSGKTTHLLAIDINSNSGKNKKARDLGVAVMTPEQFKDEFNL